MVSPADGSSIAINILLYMRRFALRASGYRQEGTSNVDMSTVSIDYYQQALNDQAIAASFGRLFQKNIVTNMNTPSYPDKEVA
jgi:pantothenate kinase